VLSEYKTIKSCCQKGHHKPKVCDVQENDKTWQQDIQIQGNPYIRNHSEENGYKNRTDQNYKRIRAVMIYRKVFMISSARGPTSSKPNRGTSISSTSVSVTTAMR